MNTSGGPVAALAQYFKVPAERVIVVHDELDLPLGALKIKKGGGHGGHNGLRDIQKALGTPEFIRVRLGIGRPPGRMDPAAYVLKPFSSSEKTEVELLQALAIDAAQAVVEHGLLEAQQRFHAPS
jgi:PTH1 family peptidyl-tRNA hydrolase